ncbi:MAG: hypothetical protein HY788_11925 [Deltaproteobacteria bacterium]|nr:hypothetical protein [Deltaproteobacteria bacterium]
MRTANAILFLVWAVVLFVIQSSGLGISTAFRTCDAGVILLIYLGLCHSLLVAAPTVLFSAMLMDSFSGAAPGAFLLLYCALFALAYFGGKKMDLRFWLYRIVAVFILDISFRVLIPGLVSFPYDPVFVPEARTFRNSVLTAAASPLLFLLFDRSETWVESLISDQRGQG